MTRKKPIKKKPSDKRKEYLKQNFAKVKPETLSQVDRNYYNKIKAGKARAKNAIRIEGKYLSGEIIDTIAKVAHSKGMKIQDYINANKEAIINLIEVGYTHVSKDIDKAIEIVNNLKRKTVEVDTGNGIVKMTKSEAINEMSAFQQHVKSTTHIVMIATDVKSFKKNKIRVTIPEGYEDYTGDELTEFLDDFEDIFYVESP
jgi:hypothetical protein